MAILQSCCFWKTVRKGSFASAFYTLIYFGFSSIIMLIYVRDERQFLVGELERPTGESLLVRGEITPAIVIFNVLFLCSSIALVVSSLLVITGLQYNRRELLLPWIVFMICDVLIEVSHLAYLSITQMVNFDPIVGFVFTVDFFIMCLNSYCLLCVISQYQDYLQEHSYGDTQRRTEMVSDIACIEGTNHAARKKSKSKHKPSSTSPFITTNPQSRFSTIPEEGDQHDKLQFSAEVISCPDDDFSAVHNMAKRSEIPNITCQ